MTNLEMTELDWTPLSYLLWKSKVGSEAYLISYPMGVRSYLTVVKQVTC